MPLPAVPRYRVLASLPRLARRPTEVFTRFFRAYGDNYLFTVSELRRTHMTIDADVVQHVLQGHHRNYHKSEIQTDQLARYLGRGLLTNNGESWLTQRRLIQPGFHRRRLAALVEAMQEVIGESTRALDRAATAGENIYLHDLTRDTVFQIIVRAIFTDGFSTAEREELNRVLDTIQGYIIYPIRMPFLRAPLRWLGLERKHLRLAQRVREIIRAKITARRAGEPRDDLLQMLLEARYADTGEAMNDEQLIDEVIILFTAGHETSANALAWTLLLLDRHPEVLQRVRAELAAVGPVDFDRVGQLTYLTQVIEEAMRLYPPAWITDRVALEDDEAAGLPVRRGTVVGIFFYGLHRNPRYFTEPDAFRPDRMHPDAKRQRHPFSFLPFGGGPRLCIGNHFAMLEMQLILARWLADYDFTPGPAAAGVRPRPTVTLNQDRRVAVGVHSRRSSAGTDGPAASTSSNDPR